MSVLLQGLSIPDGNPRTINIYRDGVWCDAYTTENGKAIEVPTPHGGLIDADALEKHIKKDWEAYDHWIAVEVENRPTVIEAEDGE